MGRLARGYSLLKAMAALFVIPRSSHSDQELSEKIRVISASGFFDAQWYLKTYPGVARDAFSALKRYVQSGGRNGQSPGPHFDSAWYLLNNPDVFKAGLDPLLHYLQFGADEGRQPISPIRILDVARQTIASLSDLEPELNKITDATLLRIFDGRPTRRTHAAFRTLFESLSRPYRYIVCVTSLSHAEYDIAAVHAIRALVERYGIESTLVVITDNDQMDGRNCLPVSVDVCRLASITAALTNDERTYVLELLIQALRPLKVLNVNSAMCWEALRRRGAAFSTFTQLFAILFSHDYAPDGGPTVCTEAPLIHCLPIFRRVYVTTTKVADQLRHNLCLPPSLGDTIKVLRQPVTIDKTPEVSVRRQSENVFRVFSVHQLCQEKDIKWLMQIAEITPHVLFDVWGRVDEFQTDRLQEIRSSLPNLIFRGPYPVHSSIQMDDYDAFLYRSHCDGLPNLLLEAAAFGVPIIAPDVGAIKELVSADTGWLVSDIDNPRAYKRSLCEIRTNKWEVLRRRDLMRKYVKQFHSWPAYVEALSEKSGLLGVV